ncbi:hypothetical protein [Pseudoalteromonas sp. SaAl2]
MKKNLITHALQLALIGGMSATIGQAIAAQEETVEKQTIKQAKAIVQKRRS